MLLICAITWWNRLLPICAFAISEGISGSQSGRQFAEKQSNSQPFRSRRHNRKQGDLFRCASGIAYNCWAIASTWAGEAAIICCAASGVDGAAAALLAAAVSSFLSISFV